LENLLTHDAVTATDGLEVTVRHGDETTLMHLHGQLSIDSSPDFRDQLLAILREQPSRALIVDVSAVSYIDASGIATLLEALKIARNCQSKLCLQGLQGHVVHLFEVTGLLGLFTNGCGSAPSAAKAF